MAYYRRYDPEYIEHGLFGSRREKKGHKYVQKIEVKGKPRYFYTNEEYQRYLKLQNGFRRTKEKAALGYSKYIKPIAKRINKFVDNASTKIKDIASDAVGYDERDAYRKAQKSWLNAREAVNNIGAYDSYMKNKEHYNVEYVSEDYRAAVSRLEDAEKEYKKATKAYYRTPLGIIDRLINDI